MDNETGNRLPVYDSFATIVVSGGFVPIHLGHCTLFRAAAAYAPLTVILNSDQWIQRKRGYSVMDWNARADILRELKSVHDVVPVDDSDGTICEALRRIRPTYFAKSGDRTPDSMPEKELETCEELGIVILYNVCEHLPYSSSQILSNGHSGKEAVWKKWGSYQVLDEQSRDAESHYKVKRLDIGPGQRISYQKHNEREEHWVVVRGTAEVRIQCGPGSYVHVPRGAWHQVINVDKSIALTLIETQMGSVCDEEDIVREADKRSLLSVGE